MAVYYFSTLASSPDCGIPPFLLVARKQTPRFSSSRVASAGSSFLALVPTSCPRWFMSTPPHQQGRQGHFTPMPPGIWATLGAPVGQRGPSPLWQSHSLGAGGCCLMLNISSPRNVGKTFLEALYFCFAQGVLLHSSIFFFFLWPSSPSKRCTRLCSLLFWQ